MPFAFTIWNYARKLFCVATYLVVIISPGLTSPANLLRFIRFIYRHYALGH
ncbi:hypothetical protein IIA29_02405 [candidate division KSB1 bacterium]|nr:hypothetical protein [candidate division KSB1 bacterium]